MGAMVAAGSHVQEALLSLLHTQHEGARSPLRCLQGNSHVGSVTAVGTLHCACMSVWEFANFLASLPAVIGTQRGIATLCKGLNLHRHIPHSLAVVFCNKKQHQFPPILGPFQSSAHRK